MKKFKNFINEKQELLLMGGQSAERQETGFVNAINNTYQKVFQPINVNSKELSIKNVMGAEKFSGRSIAGTEPYTDVIVTFLNKTKKNISMKGPTAPSLAGGGLAGIELVLPGIGKNFMAAARKHLIAKGFKKGDKVPDVYAKLNDKDKLLLVIGNKSNGGPIDYMYIGPMDVISTTSGKTLSLNGALIDATKYAKTHDLYFRLRARREDQTFDPDAKDGKGIYNVYGKSPTRGDSKGRIVITDKVPAARDIITF
jgi:hypothetical protein